MRVFGTVVFDKLDKMKLILGALAALILCLVALPGIRSMYAYILLAAVYGGSIGVVLPMLNALLFSASPPALRGLNTNMSLFAMDAGYFLTPYLGRDADHAGRGFQHLFYSAAGFTLLCLSLILALRRTKGERIDE